VAPNKTAKYKLIQKMTLELWVSFTNDYVHLYTQKNFSHTKKNRNTCVHACICSLPHSNVNE